MGILKHWAWLNELRETPLLPSSSKLYIVGQYTKKCFYAFYGTCGQSQVLLVLLLVKKKGQ